ncbi:amino acid permease [candidate division WOR-3 bacterium]|nr:amino acid permease [candidate division WOR-3 bacterium]
MNSLKKDLGFLEIYCIATGTMISSGIFILPGLAFSKTGPAVFVSYLFSGILALLGLLSIVELSSAMPKAGGDYFYITRSLGPLTGTISGLISWLGLSMKTAFAVIGIAEILFIILGVNVYFSAVTLSVFFVFLNIIGVKDSAIFQSIVVVGLVLIVSFYIIVGIGNIDIMRFERFSSGGINSIMKTSGFVFVAYGGLLKITTVAEEVKNPRKNLPLGLFVSLFTVIVFYSLMSMVAVGTLTPDSLSGSLTPIADSAKTFSGGFGYYALTLAAMLAFISTGNAGIMAASRYPYALSRDKLLPKIFGKIPSHPRTPVFAVVLTGIIIVSAFFLKLENLVKVASTSIILTYILIQISLIVLRESRIENYQPTFKSPLYPWLQILSVILYCFLIVDMGIKTVLTSMALVFTAVIFYFAYGRIKNKNEYALLHLVERITNKKMHSDSLELELKKVISDRDEIVFDRFDKLIDNALVYDIDAEMNLEELFSMISEDVADKLNADTETIKKSFMDRENLASTAITPFVAIPHIIVEGEKIFEIIVARSLKGLVFSEEKSSVRAVFVVIGSLDERNFHLQALSAIAQIVLNRKFEKRWLNCKNLQAIKNLIQLSERRRFE